MKESQEYGIYSDFDIEKHKQTFVKYFEVVICEDGTVVYAVPSHQNKIISLACEKLGVSKTELEAMCPTEYHFDYMTWLCKISGAAAVWEKFYIAEKLNKKQLATLKKLKLEGLYNGPIFRNTKKRREEYER